LAYNGYVRFQWDDAKNAANRKKHGLSFEEAQVLFARSDRYLEIFDEAHSIVEDRFIAIGPISHGIIVVVYTEQDEDVIRIISAREATRQEALMYRAYMKGNR
jgi:uncharacterized DUF497 family protein